MAYYLVTDIGLLSAGPNFCILLCVLFPNISISSQLTLLIPSKPDRKLIYEVILPRKNLHEERLNIIPPRILIITIIVISIFIIIF